jgi:predicted signal transduction protein with EAL and GGDEF domain
VLVQDARLVAGGQVSVSVGVVELAQEQSASEWIEEADAALYRAKRAGRNRVAGTNGDPLSFPADHTVHDSVRLPLRIS